MATNSTIPHRSRREQLLAMLHRGGAWAYLWTSYSEQPHYHGATLWFKPGTFPHIPLLWTDTYFGVHPCVQPAGPHARAGSDGERLAVANCLYADFDAKDNPDGIDGIFDWLDTLLARGVMYPTATVLSGGGLHAYWCFESTVNLHKPANRQRLARWQRLWVDQVVRADPSAKDLSRVLRLPGTQNHKYDPPREVQIVELNEYRVFRLQDLGAILYPKIELEDAAICRRQQRVAEVAGEGFTWARLVRWAEKDAVKGARHRTALRLAFRLKEAGCPRATADRIVGNFVQAVIDDRPTGHEAEGMVSYVYRN